METRSCSYSQHQATDLMKSTQYLIARAVIDSLIEDCNQAIEAIQGVNDLPAGQEVDSLHAQGQVSAYNAVLSNLELWRDVLLK